MTTISEARTEVQREMQQLVAIVDRQSHPSPDRRFRPQASFLLPFAS